METVWMTVTVLKCRRLHFLYMPYILSKVQIYTILCVGYWLKEMFELLRIRSISQYLAAPFSHCKVMIDNMFHNSGPYFIWGLCLWPLLLLPLFYLCTLPPCILTPLLPLVCWPWSFSGCSSIVRICNSCVVLCLYMLSNWRFMRCTFELFQRTGLSLIDLHLFISESQDSPAQFMENLQKV